MIVEDFDEGVINLVSILKFSVPAGLQPNFRS